MTLAFDYVAVTGRTTGHIRLEINELSEDDQEADRPCVTGSSLLLMLPKVSSCIQSEGKGVHLAQDPRCTLLVQGSR